jgi:hypothetical protein
MGSVAILAPNQLRQSTTPEPSRGFRKRGAGAGTTIASNAHASALHFIVAPGKRVVKH